MRIKSFCLPACRVCLLLLSACLICRCGFSQSDAPSHTGLASTMNSISDKDFDAAGKKLQLLEKNMDQQTQQLIARMERHEYRLQKKVRHSDSVRWKEVFSGMKEKYQQLQQDAASTAARPDQGMAEKLKTYIPGIDSLQTSLRFLQLNNTGIAPDKIEKLRALSSKIREVQTRLQVSSQVQAYLIQRGSDLKQQLAGFKLGNKLTDFQKETYYYQQRIAQFKQAFNDKDKLKQAVLQGVTAQPAFQKFWQKNSVLASMFPISGDNDTATEASLAGLQTRSQVNKLISDRLGKATPAPGQPAGDGQAYLAQQVQMATSQLDAVKNKVRQLGINGNSSDIVVPDFVPNDQRTKTFLQRLELSFNIQNAPTTNLLPATSNIALMLGYKVSDKVTIGAGLAYLLGWGRPVKDIHFNSQGIGLRGFTDIKLKGSFWATGGFEYNYMSAFSSIASIRDLNKWQKSALIGLTKKYRIGNKTGSLQLFYDLLAARQIPATAPIKFRVGYSF